MNRKPAPETINGYPVILAVPLPAGPWEMGSQYRVAVRDTRREGKFIQWTIAWDESYQGGSWVAFWGHYDLTEAQATDRAKGIKS